MLYDILPPLFLLASFGGITVIISRVVVRVQRDRLSAELKAHAASSRPVTEDDLLRSNSSKVSVVANRLLLVPGMMRSVADSAKGLLQRRKQNAAHAAQATATALRSGVQQSSRLTSGVRSLAERGKERLAIRRQATAPEEIESVEVKTPSATQPMRADKVSIRRVNVSEEKEVSEQKSQDTSVAKLLRRKKPAPVDPLGRAAACLKQSQYDQAEDILLPYIVRHAKDVKAYMLLGRAAMGRADWDEAIEIFQQVKSIDETTPRLHASLGAAAVKAGRMTLAVECLQKARDLEPANVAVRKLLLTIARRTDNSVLEKSVREELRELRQEQAPAKAE